MEFSGDMVISLIFPKVPQSSLGILRVPHLEADILMTWNDNDVTNPKDRDTHVDGDQGWLSAW